MGILLDISKRITVERREISTRFIVGEEGSRVDYFEIDNSDLPDFKKAVDYALKNRRDIRP